MRKDLSNMLLVATEEGMGVEEDGKVCMSSVLQDRKRAPWEALGRWAKE
jgi:hypothetical protein